MAADVLGPILQGQGQQAAAKANAAQDRANAAVINQQTGLNVDQGLRGARKAIGAMSASIAENGTGFDGTGADLLHESAANATLDALNTQYGGVLKSKGLQNQASISTFMGKQYGTAGYIGGWTSAENVAAKAYTGG